MKMIKLTECHAFPLPEWIINQQFGELWDNLRDNRLKPLFETQACIALCDDLKKIPFIMDADYILHDDDYFVKRYDCPLNSIVVYVSNSPSDWQQMLNQVVSQFPIGLYGHGIESLTPQLVTQINDNGDTVMSYELADGTVQKLGKDAHGYYFEW